MHQANGVPDTLPSTRRLVRSTVAALGVAGVLLVAVVLPAEYGVDPVGIGHVLGLTEMGRIKMELAREAANADDNGTVLSTGSPSQRAGSSGAPEHEWRDSVTVTLAPGKGIELKLEMEKGQQAMYQWRADSADVVYNAHGEPPDPPRGFSHSYGRGVSRGAEGDLVAAFDGIHGWHWRNRSEGPVHITLKTRGEYQALRQLK